MFIDKLHIENFKGFSNEELELHDRFTVIIGNNGMGKTTLLEALAIASGCYLIPLGGGKKFQRTINRNEIHKKETEISVFEPQLPCKIEAEGNYGGERIKWTRAIESMSFSNTVKETKSITDISKKELKDAIESNSNTILPVFAFHGTGRLWAELNDSVKYIPQGSKIEGYEDCFSAKSSSKSFRNWYKTLEKNIDKKGSQELQDRLKLFRETIVSCVDDWDGIYYDFAEDDIIGIQHINGKESHMPYRLMSDGYRSMIGMIADIAYRCIKLNPQLGIDTIKKTPGLVLIDEIDLHLHPSWQKNIVKELSTCFPNIQFVATTHSPFVVQSLNSSQLYDLNKKPLMSEPINSSLETNALYMGVDSPKSEFLNKKEKAAFDFYNFLNDDKENKNEAEANKIINKYMIEYCDDPAFIAKLRIEETAKYNK